MLCNLQQMGGKWDAANCEGFGAPETEQCLRIAVALKTALAAVYRSERTACSLTSYTVQRVQHLYSLTAT